LNGDKFMQEKMPAGYLRLPQIIGNKKAKPPIPALIPVCATTWWNGVKSGKYPAPVKLSARTTAWKVEDIIALMDSIGAAQ
jgi:prophage regulatory protein